MISLRSTAIGVRDERGRSTLRARGGRGTAVAFLALGSLLAAPAAAGTLHPRSFAPVDRFGVGIRRCTFVDRSRHVLNYSTTPASVFAPVRTLVTEIRYPAQTTAGASGETPGAAPVARTGGYPLIVFAHGYDVTPDTYAALLDAWTRAGFVVAAPFLPDEQPSAIQAQHGADTEGDLANEPGDLAFVTRAILQASSTPTTECPFVDGLVRPTGVALAGHSDGGNAVAMLAYDTGTDPQGATFASLRAGIGVRAVIIMSGDEVTGQPYGAEPSRPNLLIIHSLGDRCNPIHYGVKLYDAIRQPNKWFLELQAAHHLPAFDGADARSFKVVAATSTRFLLISLAGHSFPTRLLVYANQQPAIAQLYAGGPGPSLAHAPKLVEYCGFN
jgi:poly(3-hydroxybutyrate) depolymerase